MERKWLEGSFQPQQQQQQASQQGFQQSGGQVFGQESGAEGFGEKSDKPKLSEGEKQKLKTIKELPLQQPSKPQQGASTTQGQSQ